MKGLIIWLLIVAFFAVMMASIASHEFVKIEKALDQAAQVAGR
jgi:hypothetical protein